MAGKSARKIIVAVVAALFAMAPSASAQITTGSVSGSVKDAQGGVIPGATVTLTSDTRGTQLAPVVTNQTGDFVFVNVPTDTYTIGVAMSGFKGLKRAGVSVSAGDRVAIGSLTIEVGGASVTVNVTADSPIIQAASGERSFTIATEAVENLPIANRSFTALATLAPGVSGTNRIGGGGASNILMDGVSTLDTGSNTALFQMNVESIAEVKVLTSTYQAEYGRSSGLQIMAVTKSGTNRFRGSVYDVERDSDWNANSRVTILNGDPKTVSKERDWGYSMGGPVGKPGGRNKLFFFYAQEFRPRTAGNDVVRFRMPTALERQGDFSQTIDNNGNLFNAIYDVATGLPKTQCVQGGPTAACFQDGGVVGRIPASRLYQTGLNILKMYPLPNLADVPAGQNYNFEITRPIEKTLSWQPAIRLDYQPVQKLRATFKYSGQSERTQDLMGTLPGWNDTRRPHPVFFSVAVTANYMLNSTTFLEGTYGRSQNELGALPVNPVSNPYNVGLGDLPMLFPDATIIAPNYYTHRALDMVQPPFWDGTRVVKPPTFAWGNRIANAPPSVQWPAFLNINPAHDVAISLTKVAGRHTWKTGFYNTYAFKAVALNPAAFPTVTFANDTANPLDSQFGFANASLGIFSAYQQASKYVETNSTYYNTEAYIQDNWKVSSRLTLDYGLRLVHQQPQHDILGQASNFLPETWTPSKAPLLYVSGCANGVYPCTGTNRQAMNPLTGQFLGPNSSLAISTIVPNSGSPTNGLFQQGRGISENNFIWPALRLAPRVGLAYDVTGKQKLVLRGGAGLFFDRPAGGAATAVVTSVTNPPTSRTITVRYGQMQTLGSGLVTEGAPALQGLYEYDTGALPSSTQWNGGVQIGLPWAVALDIAYAGQHSFNMPQAVGINAIDLGAAFRPENQDRTLTATATAGGAAVSTDLMRGYRGFGSITQLRQFASRTFHSLQLSFNRRFRNGVSFGFNDTISLYDHQSTPLRLDHNFDGSFYVREDQREGDQLLGTTVDQTHILKANFVWDLPDLARKEGLLRAVALVANDWQLSGIWTGATGSPYTVDFSYQSGGTNVNLTGSPDYNARIRVVGDPGDGCSGDVYRQFNTAAFQGPLAGSVGLESGLGYVRGCFTNTLDLAIARNIKLGGNRNLQLRVDMFNAPNAAGITARNTTLNLTSPNDPVTATNLPFDAAGNLVASRSRPRGAGFGVVTGYQAQRTVQAQIRFSF